MTGQSAEALKHSARLIMVPVGPYLDLERVDQWASDPPEMNVLNADDFFSLVDDIPAFLADMCPILECDETIVDKGQTYRGCQTRTKSGRECQKWSSQTPHGHPFTPEEYYENGIGDHNMCRNPYPDYDPEIWCYTTDPEIDWEYCDPKPDGTYP